MSNDIATRLGINSLESIGLSPKKAFERHLIGVARETGTFHTLDENVDGLAKRRGIAIVQAPNGGAKVWYGLRVTDGGTRRHVVSITPGHDGGYIETPLGELDRDGIFASPPDDR